MSAEKKSVVSGALSLDGLTAAQKEAVSARGRVLVSASAGSGKTTTMVKKIIAAVADGVSLGDMLVLVYNDAAANELRERLHGALFDAACVSDGKNREVFREALDALGAAQIGTIHSFCRSLIKENFEKLGISPSFDILSEREAEKYEDEALGVVFARLFDDKDATFMQLADALSSKRKEDGLRAAVRKIYSVIEIQSDRVGFAEKIRAGYRAADGGEYRRVLEEALHSEARRIREALESVLPVHAATGQKSWLLKCSAVARMCAEAEEADFARITELAADTSVFGMRAAKKEGADDDAVELGKDACNAAKKMFADWLSAFGGLDIASMHAQNAVFVDKLLELAKMLDDELFAMKRTDDVMTYADLEYFAAELVRMCDFKGRFKAVFVDEYQDVNPVQEFIINSLLPEDAFMVGDVKQCIYAFRLADPDIFLRRKRDYDANNGGKAIEFNVNFRSVSAVLKFVNEIFDVVMTKESAGVDYASDGHFGNIEKTDSPDAGSEGGAEVHVFPYKGRSSKPGIYEEARFIAGKIRELTANAKGENGRPVGFGDCVVLVRSRSADMKRLASYLADEGIPVDDGIFDGDTPRAERELVRFLSVLNNPRDDINLAGFMLSYFGGFDESELALIAAERTDGGDFYDAVLAAAGKDTTLGKKTAAMLAMLDEYRLKASFKNVTELMQSIVSDFDLDAYAATESEGGAEKLLSFIATTEGRESSSGIGKFLAAYAAAQDGRAETKRPAGGNRVRFATYHAYKGLESPVVFAAGAAAGASGRRTDGTVLTDNKGFVGLNYYDFVSRREVRTLSYHALRRMTAERERRESMRLYYVLLTRAKQYLYVTGACGEKKAANLGKRPLITAPESLLDYIFDVRFRHGLSAPCIKHEVAENAPGVVIDRPLPPLGSVKEEDAEIIAKTQSFKYPYTAETELSMKYSVSALDGGGDELTLGAFADRADEGIIYHKIMERIDLGASDEEAVCEELNRMVAEGSLTAEETEQVDLSAVVRCLKSPLMQKARESTCYREKSFLMYVPAAEVGQGGSKDKVLVQGVIDLLIDGDERVIVDFKNSLLQNAEALEKYKKQLKLYKKAVESSFLGKVDKILLYSFKTGKIVDAEKDI